MKSATSTPTGSSQSSRVERIPIKSIRIDGDTQQRAAIDQEHVGDLSAAIVSGAKLPPVRVMFDGNDYWLYDGFHRYYAAVAEGRTVIGAEVTRGTREDARRESYRPWNAPHGLKESRPDKANRIQRAVNDALFESWPHRKLADLLDVDHKTVASYREAKVGNSPLAAAEDPVLAAMMKAADPEAVAEVEAAIDDGQSRLTREQRFGLRIGWPPEMLFEDRTYLDNERFVEWMKHQIDPRVSEGYIPIITYHPDVFFNETSKGCWIFHTLLVPSGVRRKAIGLAFDRIRNYAADVLSAEHFERLAKLKERKSGIDTDFYEGALIYRQVRDQQLYRDAEMVAMFRQHWFLDEGDNDVPATYDTYDGFLLDFYGNDERGLNGTCGPLINKFEGYLAEAN